MAWTNIPDKATGDLIDETWYDTHFKANMEFLKTLIQEMFAQYPLSVRGVGPTYQTAATSYTQTAEIDMDFTTMPVDIWNTSWEVHYYLQVQSGGAGTAYARLVDSNNNYIAGTEVSTANTSPTHLSASFTPNGAWTAIRLQQKHSTGSWASQVTRWWIEIKHT